MIRVVTPGGRRLAERHVWNHLLRGISVEALLEQAGFGPIDSVRRPFLGLAHGNRMSATEL